MNIVGIIILIVGLLVGWYVGRSYYKKDTRIVSWIVVVLIAFFAARLALKLSNTELRSVRPSSSLWTGFILSSIIALISFLMGEKEEVIYRCGKAGCGCEDGGICTNTMASDAGSCCSTKDANDTCCSTKSPKTLACGCVGKCSCFLPCGCKKGSCTCKAKVAVATAGASLIPAYSGTPDDLKIIEGIGPVLEGILNSHGIYTFAQIGAMAPEAVKEVLDREGERFRTHTTESRPLQARFADQGRMKELKAMKDELDGGRFIANGKYTAQSV